MRHYDVALLMFKTKQDKTINLVYNSLSNAVKIALELRKRPNIEYAEAFPKKIEKFPNHISYEQHAEELENEYTFIEKKE